MVHERDVTLDLRRIRAEEVKLHDASTGRIAKRSIAPSGDAELAVRLVAEFLDAPALAVEISQVSNERHQIDDRLGGQPRHRRRADMMDGHQGRAEYTQAFGMARRQPGPLGIMRDQDDWDRRWHSRRLRTG